MALFTRFPAYFISSLLLLYIQPVYTKECKKINACRCEMDDGSGVIDLWDLDNKDGTPRFTGIKDALDGSTFTYSFNPCTPISGCDGETNLCQDSTYPCGKAGPTFTVDGSGNVILNFEGINYDSLDRAAQITLVCDKDESKGKFGAGIKEIPGTGYSLYTGTLTVKSACLVPSSGSSSGLTIGSILLIIFFPLVFLYVVFGIVFNVYVRHKQAIPDVCPNHTFWAALPFLVKDGCVFSCHKLKNCCSLLYAKSKGETYENI